MYINSSKENRVRYQNKLNSLTNQNSILGVEKMSSISNVTQGINADILTNMKSSKKILSKVAEDRQQAAIESKEYFKEVINKSTEIKDNVAKGINVDITV